MAPTQQKKAEHTINEKKYVVTRYFKGSKDLKKLLYELAVTSTDKKFNL